MASPYVHVFNEQNFSSDVWQSDIPVLVHFRATWNGPCRALAPVVDLIADEQAGVVKVGNLDIDENPQITARYAIRQLPMLLIFKGGQEVERIPGLPKKDQIMARLQPHL